MSRLLLAVTTMATAVLVVAAAGPAALAAEETVSIRKIKFTPASVAVKPGDTVVWANNDDRDHTVTADDGSFDSGKIGPGESFQFTFEEAGQFSYHCEFHPRMKAVVVVKR
jgi:plastocyanin